MKTLIKYCCCDLITLICKLGHVQNEIYPTLYLSLNMTVFNSETKAETLLGMQLQGKSNA